MAPKPSSFTRKGWIRNFWGMFCKVQTFLELRPLIGNLTWSTAFLFILHGAQTFKEGFFYTLDWPERNFGLVALFSASTCLGLMIWRVLDAPTWGVTVILLRKSVSPLGGGGETPMSRNCHAHPKPIFCDYVTQRVSGHQNLLGTWKHSLLQPFPNQNV